jgi:hypothetical protein
MLLALSLNELLDGNLGQAKGNCSSPLYQGKGGPLKLYA